VTTSYQHLLLPYSPGPIIRRYCNRSERVMLSKYDRRVVYSSSNRQSIDETHQSYALRQAHNISQRASSPSYTQLHQQPWRQSTQCAISARHAGDCISHCTIRWQEMFTRVTSRHVFEQDGCRCPMTTTRAQMHNHTRSAWRAIVCSAHQCLSCDCHHSCGSLYTMPQLHCIANIVHARQVPTPVCKAIHGFVCTTFC